MHSFLHPAPIENECILGFTVIGQLQRLPCQFRTSHEGTGIRMFAITVVAHELPKLVKCLQYQVSMPY